MKSGDRNKLSEEFKEKLTSISAGYIPPDSLEALFRTFEKEISSRFFTFGSESNLLRIILGMYDKITFLNECLRYPHYIEIIAAVAANSNYLTDILVRNPEYFYLIINPSVIDAKRDPAGLPTEIGSALDSYKSFAAKVNALRSLKRKEVLKIGIRDILGKATLKETTQELSILARSIAAELFELSYREILKKYEVQNNRRYYCLISLGKLGGGELNYSSDIDLIVFFDKDSSLGKKQYSEILTEAVYLFIECASSVTGSGFMYRVDFRLRPDGRNSPLCRSLNEYLAYYESRGEDWERQMLIKSGFVGGSKTLYDKFIAYMSHFIYPLSFSSSPTEQIRRLKENIERSIGEDENIKLISGGIRDIEFSVQALQLLNGGRDKSLRTGNTLEAVEVLCSAGLLQDNEAENLKNAYTLYRRVEHYLQLMNDTQTHTIPSEGETLEKMSSFLGFKSSHEFKNTINKNRKAVLRIYNSVMGVKRESGAKKIREINFENKTRAERDLRYLKEGVGLLGQKQFDSRTTQDFINIEPALRDYLTRSLNPDLVLQNFARIIRTSKFPSIWYREFAKVDFFKLFLKICEFSQKSVDLFAEDERLIEQLLTRRVFTKVKKEDVTSHDMKELLFALSVQFTLDLISAEKVSDYLAIYVKNKIAQTAESSPLNGIDYFIAAMGSLGAGEMSFASDIDLIFVVKDIENIPDVQAKFQHLFLDMKETLRPFDVDCRLRPEGKSSLLAWDLKAYKNYVMSRARTWELQAFCKLNFICGDKKAFGSLVASVKKRIDSENPAKLKSDMHGMRINMYPQNISSVKSFTNLKKSPGGITDIEFIQQLLIFQKPEFFSICLGSNKVKILKTFEIQKYRTELLPLKDNFLFLKKLEMKNQTVFNTGTTVLPGPGHKLETLARQMGLNSAAELNKMIESTMKENYSYYRKIFKVKN